MDCLSSQSCLSVKIPKGITELAKVTMLLQSPHGTVSKDFNVSESAQSADARIVMKVPSVNEKVFAEKRDFYVFGAINKDLVKVPGNVKVEIFRSGKLLVTNDYFAALIQGGLTKDFDTTYQDAEGNPLADLTRGEYEIKVTGLSGDLEGFSWSSTVYFEPIRKIFSPFRPEDTHKKKLFSYASQHCLRKFWDPFAGYFLVPAENYGGGTYTISRRYRSHTVPRR